MQDFALPNALARPVAGCDRAFLGPQQVRQAEAAQPQSAGDEHVAACQAVAEAFR